MLFVVTYRFCGVMYKVTHDEVFHNWCMPFYRKNKAFKIISIQTKLNIFEL